MLNQGIIEFQILQTLSNKLFKFFFFYTMFFDIFENR